MVAQSAAALKTQTDANVTSNSNKENTGARVRTLLNDFADSSWNVIDYPIATQVEAETGTAADRFMTPQRTAQAIQLSLNGLLDGAPAALDTLNELAAAIADDANYAATMTTALAGKASLAAANTFTAPQLADTLALTHNTAWDGTAKQHLTVDVNASNFTIANPSAQTAGVYYTVYVAYTTTHTLAWGNAFKGVLNITPSATAGSVDHFTFRSNGTHLQCVGHKLGAGA